MSTQVEAIYENGVFRPLRPVALPEHRRVTLTVEEGEPADPGAADRVEFVLSADRWQAFCEALDAPPKEIPALKKLLTEASVLDGNRPAAD